jgi:hypothetical protein
MSICNRCALKRIRETAKLAGKRVRVSRDPFHVWSSGVSVFVLNKDEKPCEDNKVAWFAEVTEQCCC